FTHYPADLEKIDLLVILGGASGRGTYGPYDEYNVSVDPEAAKIVFESGVKIRVEPLELGHQAFVKQDTMDVVKNYGK
ncbi:nucleoside hydrolase, partial [Lactobacillus jensenii]|uniref:nucleoside hydrolase n=1 Tax=Lactobacillus jensenii TaxID=109790 RepID=UPI00287047B3